MPDLCIEDVTNRDRAREALARLAAALDWVRGDELDTLALALCDAANVLEAMRLAKECTP